MKEKLSTQQCSLSVSCVFYDTDLNVVRNTLSSLWASAIYAKHQALLESIELHLINNNPLKEKVFLDIAREYEDIFDKLIIHNGHGNIGYGKANNLAIHQAQSTYHLILNPDVEISEAALATGINYLNEHEDTGLVAPQAINEKSETEFLAKRSPSFLIIFLRGINNKTLNTFFRKKLDWYTYKDKIPSPVPFEIELASGCFMLCTTLTLKKVKGFSEEYFLYFEDFDLSQKIRKLKKIIYLPKMEIIHLGGNAAQKSSTHIKLFFKSFLIFQYNRYFRHRN